MEGGAETRTKEVAFRAAKLGHEITIYCGKTNIDEQAEVLVNQVKVIHKKVMPDWLVRRFPYPSYVSMAAASLFLFIPLLSFLKRERYDVIREDFAPFPPTGPLALVRLLGLKRIAMAHNLSSTLKGWTKFYGPIYGLAGYLAYRLLVSGRFKYDRIVCAARFLAEDLKRHPNISDKVAYIPNGINLNDFKRNGVKREQGETIRLLCAGRLVELKGFRFAIEAMGYLKNEYPQVKLDILGKGPAKESLAQLSEKLGVSHMVRFLAPVDHSEMSRVYNEYQFLVMPSLTEGFPMTLIEAMASHLPIVATDIPAVRAVLPPESATLVMKENGRDLAEKLKWAFENPEPVRRGADKAYEIAKEYDWDQTTIEEIEH